MDVETSGRASFLSKDVVDAVRVGARSSDLVRGLPSEVVEDLARRAGAAIPKNKGSKKSSLTAAAARLRLVAASNVACLRDVIFEWCTRNRKGGSEDPLTSASTPHWQVALSTLSLVSIVSEPLPAPLAEVSLKVLRGDVERYSEAQLAAVITWINGCYLLFGLDSLRRAWRDGLNLLGALRDALEKVPSSPTESPSGSVWAEALAAIREWQPKWEEVSGRAARDLEELPDLLQDAGLPITDSSNRATHGVANEVLPGLTTSWFEEVERELRSRLEGLQHDDREAKLSLLIGLPVQLGSSIPAKDRDTLEREADAIRLLGESKESAPADGVAPVLSVSMTGLYQEPHRPTKFVRSWNRISRPG